jgi:hypothetical protein
LCPETYVEIEQTFGNYIIRVRGPNAKAVAKQMAEAAKALGTPGVAGRAIPSRAKSLTEFVNSLDPKSDLDRALCCACFLQTQRGNESITSKDLRAAYREAKLPKSPNFSQAIASNVNKGYLAPTGKKKDGYDSYYVTLPGIRYVNSGLKAK